MCCGQLPQTKSSSIPVVAWLPHLILLGLPRTLRVCTRLISLGSPSSPSQTDKGLKGAGAAAASHLFVGSIGGHVWHFEICLRRRCDSHRGGEAAREQKCERWAGMTFLFPLHHLWLLQFYLHPSTPTPLLYRRCLAAPVFISFHFCWREAAGEIYFRFCGWRCGMTIGVFRWGLNYYPCRQCHCCVTLWKQCYWGSLWKGTIGLWTQVSKRNTLKVPFWNCGLRSSQAHSPLTVLVLN